MNPRNLTLYDMIRQNARLHARREAIVFNDVRLSYKEYERKCDQLAAGLVREGIIKGDRLGIVSHNCDEFMILYGAAAKIGAILVPVNWRFQQEEVEYVLRDGSPKIVFAGPDYRRTVMEIAKKVEAIKEKFTIGGGKGPRDSGCSPSCMAKPIPTKNLKFPLIPGL